MQETKRIELFITPDRGRSYFTLPFEMPPNVETLALSYQYERYTRGAESHGFTAVEHVNTIDLGLISPDGSQVGASGSDKSSITIGPVSATPGYQVVPLVPGEWQILVGAYKVGPAGVTVAYELTFTFKEPHWLKGDFHTHTFGSDGVLSAAELGMHALRHGLDFIAITDHNQFVDTASLPSFPGLTIIPGVEWTHYDGHANFLGIEKPYDEPFFTNSLPETLTRFSSARQRGALIVINHPFDEGSGFKFDFNALPFDCLEIWNGPMRESNLRALALWQNLLTAGHKIPMVGGSDYHRDNLFQILGGPTTCVYSLSHSGTDILSALKAGHAYLIFSPLGPALRFNSGEAMMGDSLSWKPNVEVQIEVEGLLPGDVVRLVTAKGSYDLVRATAAGNLSLSYPIATPGFARVEVLRSFLAGIPPLPALISNPIYFD